MIKFSGYISTCNVSIMQKYWNIAKNVNNQKTTAKNQHFLIVNLYTFWFWFWFSVFRFFFFLFLIQNVCCWAMQSTNKIHIQCYVSNRIEHFIVHFIIYSRSRLHLNPKWKWFHSGDSIKRMKSSSNTTTTTTTILYLFFSIFIFIVEQ